MIIIILRNREKSKRNGIARSREICYGILFEMTHNRSELQRTLSVMERQVGKDHGNLPLSLRKLEEEFRQEISSLSQKLCRVWLVSGFLSLAILLALLVILGK